jgi:UDP-2,4-diacetamido-2,4,6-trideoxy-beta-L-altropyranose hydrolase
MLNLRRVSEKDSRLIWKWANDPEVRAVSFFTETFPYEEHVKWFETKLDSQNCYFYIAENTHNAPVGQVRYDVKGNDATISVSLDRNYRGKGYGPELIQLSSKKIFNETDVKVIHAYIKKVNTASLKAFNAAGFIVIEDIVIRSQTATHLILKKKN